MSSAYTIDKMSVKTRAICERGKFFIETGTASGFKKFVRGSAKKIAQYVPDIWLGRIEDLINKGDRDGAVLLWVQVCHEADTVPSRRRRILIFYISYFAIGLMALYAFLKTL